MNRPVFFGLLLAAAAISHLSASDYLERFRTVSQSKDNGKIEAFLNEAATTEKENPDFYATASNYWWSASRAVNITTKPSGPGDFSVADPKSGKEVGSISFGARNPTLSKKAETLLKEGIAKFPQRADLALGLAAIQRELNDSQGFTETLLVLLEEARKDPEKLRWKENGPIPGQTPAVFLPEALQTYSALLFQREDAESTKQCKELTAAIIKTFPAHPYAYNIQGALLASEGKPDEAIALYKLACEKHPADAILHFNLVHLYRITGKPTQARAILEQIRDNPKIDQAARDEAKDALTRDAATAPTPKS